MYEDERISWDGVFKHPIFGNRFNKELSENANLENVFKKIMADIRFQVNSKNLHLKKLWTNLGYGVDKELNNKEFKDFLQCVVPNMATRE